MWQTLPWPSESPDVLLGHLHTPLFLLPPVLPRVANLRDHLFPVQKLLRKLPSTPISIAHHCFPTPHSLYLRTLNQYSPSLFPV